MRLILFLFKTYSTQREKNKSIISICLSYNIYSFKSFVGGNCRSAGLKPRVGETIADKYTYSIPSLVAQLVRNPPSVQETSVQPLGWEDPLEKG